MEKKKKIEHKTSTDEFFYNVQVRKTLILTATRYFSYAKQLYSIPVTDLIDFGMETRYAYYQLLQLTFAKLFSNVNSQKYNFHRVLKQFREDSNLRALLTVSQFDSLTNRLTAFGPTIEGYALFGMNGWHIQMH